jgi:hypothetical protein
MTQRSTNFLSGFMTCLFFLLFIINATSFAKQENAVDPKLLEELVGNYEFNIQGQTGVFIFSAEDGNLMGAPAGESHSLLKPVEGEEMTFIGHSPDGTELHFKFVRDEEGKVAKCVISIPVMGLVADMFKMKE